MTIKRIMLTLAASAILTASGGCDRSFTPTESRQFKADTAAMLDRNQRAYDRLSPADKRASDANDAVDDYMDLIRSMN